MDNMMLIISQYCPLPLFSALAWGIMLSLPSPFSSSHSPEIESASVPEGALAHGKRLWWSRIIETILSQRLLTMVENNGCDERE
jgi:hypothetical protein